MRRWGLLLAVTFLLMEVGCSAPAEGGASPEAIGQGKVIYSERCATCHGDAATGIGRADLAYPVHGPDGHTWHHADGQLADIILGRFTYPGRMMPSFADVVTEKQVDDVLAYLKQGWLPEQVAFQKQVSEN